MRLNKFIALASSKSRRQADELIAKGQVRVNGQVGRVGQAVEPADLVELDGKVLQRAKLVYLVLNKPVGYVCSRRGQGSPTIYELLPQAQRPLKCVGRLDKDTSGLLLLSNDGDWAHQLTHPKFAKRKIYELRLNRPLSVADRQQIESGINLEDGVSRLEIVSLSEPTRLVVALTEGRNRQIRRTFLASGYSVVELHRTQFGPYRLEGLKSGEFKKVSKIDA